jgi:hypothetical protein
MPLCIAGMHRSGTSMLTGLLQACGLHLGPLRDLLPPQPDNPEGYWENRSFLRINERILDVLGGDWKNPPPNAAVDAKHESRLRKLKKQGRNLAQRFHGREPWGWKDPRNCLTLPFWRNVVPTAKVLICVRNPLAVAESLRLRDALPTAISLELWLSYNRRLLEDAPLRDRLITHYESYILDPEQELRRVLVWAGISMGKDGVAKACQRFNPSLLHHRMTVDDLSCAGVPSELEQCYLNLWHEAETSLQGDAAHRHSQRLPRPSFTRAS